MSLYAAFHSKQTLTVTVTLEVGTRVLPSTLCLGILNTCVKIFQKVSIQEKVTAGTPPTTLYVLICSIP